MKLADQKGLSLVGALTLVQVGLDLPLPCTGPESEPNRIRENRGMEGPLQHRDVAEQPEQALIGWCAP